MITVSYKGGASLKRYVIGFAFTPNRLQVALILREWATEESSWQLGKMNGLGGKIKPGEILSDAMEREFGEESGVTIPAERWQYRGVYLKADEWKVFVFTVFDDLVYGVRTNSEEGKVQLVGVPNLSYLPVVANVRWLVPMLLNKDLKSFEMEEV